MRFNPIAVALSAWLAAFTCLAQQATPGTAAPSDHKWTVLFNGKSLAGWEALPTSARDSTGDWRIENGSLVCPGTSAGWLASSKSFENFVLELDFRGPETVNSGVFIRSAKQGQPHLTGYEVQIWDHQPAGYTTGSLVESLKASPATIFSDKWNSYRITADGDHFTVVLNGKTLLDGRDSKHVSAGVIGLQCQKDNKIEFRNIRIRPVKGTE